MSFQIPTEELTLVRKSLEGDEQAQYDLYNKYVQAMYHTAYRMIGNAADTEDVLQEAFTKVFHKLDSFKAESSLGAWIKRIVVNTTLNFLRGQQNTNWETVEEYGDYAEYEEEDHDGAYNVQEIHNAIQDLPDGCKSVFNLYQMEGYQHQEIAEILNISTSTSKSQYQRAKKLLRQKLTFIL